LKRGPAHGDRFRLDPVLDALALAIVVAFAGCVIAVNAGPHRIGGLDAETDFYGGYAPAAADLAHGRLLAADGKLPPVYGFVGPLYPALLAVVTPLARGAFPAALLLSLAGALATMLLWGSRLRTLFGAAAGLAAVTLLATNAVFFRQGYWVTTDAVAVAFQSLAMWLLLRDGAGAGMRGAVAAGVAAALAFLTRYTSVWLLPAGIVALALSGPGPTPWRERGLRIAAFLGGFALLALPWILFARTHGGTVQFHQLLLFDLYSTRDHMPWDEFLANVWPRFANDPWLAYRSDPGCDTSRATWSRTSATTCTSSPGGCSCSRRSAGSCSPGCGANGRCCSSRRRRSGPTWRSCRPATTIAMRSPCYRAMRRSPRTRSAPRSGSATARARCCRPPRRSR
jgi:hypothetical protein